MEIQNLEVQSLIQSFGDMLNKLEQEKRDLYMLANFQSIQNDQIPTEVVDKLIGIDKNVTDMEEQLYCLDTHIDTELAILQKIQNLTTNSKVLKENIELCFHQGGDKVSTCLENRINSAKAIEQSSATSDLVVLVTSEELDTASKATKGRLTLGQVNEYLLTLAQLIETKRKMLAQLKRSKFQDKLPITEYENKRVAEHGNSTYLTESELRISPIFESGDATGKAVLHTLRVLHRVKLIRSGSESTYILVSK